MNRHDEAIDKVLAGLRSTDAPAGMNRRILDATQARAAEASSSRWFGFKPLRFPTFSRSAAAWSLACGIVVTAAIPSIHRLTRTSTQTKVNPVALAQAPREEAENAHVAPPRDAYPYSITMPEVRRLPVLRRQNPAARRNLQVSFPAPPMALTGQEKLLLQIVHKGDPVEMAMLDPEKRNQQYANGKAEFQRFFEASPQGDTR